METLWAPWRMAYVAGPKESGCIFCTHPVAADARQALVLATTPTSVVMLNRFPYANGHLMVAPRAHTAELDQFSAVEFGALMETVRRAARVLREVFAPEGMNIGLNLGRAAGAGVADHLHWHLVPRWVGDTNFMPLIGEVRVMPEHLLATYDRLRPHFATAAASTG
ncbi:MAG: HIT domain-containing protein [Deltaproteobacteria bacterium]|nr:HIT domain-containing protein [Deltaproteobacteria bacterium]MBI3390650.1 HIT domain-containing protein [Deltaproteobacteria bacterium]